MRKLVLGMALAGMAAFAGSVFADDLQTAQEIANQLHRSGKFPGRPIAVKYQDGTVWVKGQLADPAQEESALSLLYGRSDVKNVVNLLTVGESSDSPAAEAPKAPLADRLREAFSKGSAEKAVQAKAVNHESNEDLGPVKAQPASADVTDAAIDAIAPDGEPALAPQPVLRRAAPAASNATRGTTRRAPSQTNKSTRPVNGAPRMAQVPNGRPVSNAGVAMNGGPVPMYVMPVGQHGANPVSYDQPHLPNHAWPSYASYPNYAGVMYPKQYSPTCWPYIGPFYPYPQVPLGWRKVTLEWDDGWWWLDFDDGRKGHGCGHRCCK